MGDVAIPGAGKGEQRKLAIAENKYNSKNKKTMKRLNEGLTEKGLKYLSKLIKEKGSRDAGMKVIDMILSRELGGLGIYDLPDSVTLMNGLDSIEEAFDNGDLQGGFNIAKETAMEMIEDEGGMYMEENQKQKIKESKTMKRLRFKKPFNGVENALNLIPESYKVDNKTFQMTDGNESYEIRWEGSINEGKASILKASDKTLMNEDMQRMKELFNFKSQDTLGNLKGTERLNENKQFDTIWNKTKNINEMTGGFGFTGEGNLEGNTSMIDEEDKVPNKGYIAVYRVMGQDFTVGPLDTNDKNKVAKLLNSMIMGGYKLIDIVPADKFDGVEKYGGLMLNKESVDEEEKVEEAAKPDFLDLDKDGDKEESMKKAAKEKEEEEEVNEMGLKPTDRKKKTAKAHSKKDRRAKDKKTTKKELEDMVNEVVKKKVNEEELQINKNNWSGEDATIDVNYETNEFEIPNVGTFKLEFYEDESGENAKVYLDGELDEDLKLTKFRNEWIAGNYNWEITRESKNPYIALAQLVYNLF
jgi:hypothetical protein